MKTYRLEKCLLWEGKQIISTLESDVIAQTNGFMYIEGMITALGDTELTVDEHFNAFFNVHYTNDQQKITFHWEDHSGKKFTKSFDFCEKWPNKGFAIQSDHGIIMCGSQGNAQMVDFLLKHSRQ